MICNIWEANYCSRQDSNQQSAGCRLLIEYHHIRCEALKAPTPHTLQADIPVQGSQSAQMQCNSEHTGKMHMNNIQEASTFL